MQPPTKTFALNANTHPSGIESTSVSAPPSTATTSAPPSRYCPRLNATFSAPSRSRMIMTEPVPRTRPMNTSRGAACITASNNTASCRVHEKA